MITYGIDPGTYKSALVGIDEEFKVIFKQYASNLEIEKTLETLNQKHTLCIEFVQSYGMAVGQTTFLTVRAVGRFEKAFGDDANIYLYTRPTILSHITGGVRGKKKTQVIQSLKLRFGEAKKGQPLEGISNHLWDALAVAVYHLDGAKLGHVDWAAINR
tara:strand:- start:676 stop:1152 length:477 start_codon:yes stop_codon:yes gene_type:complete